MYQRTLLPSGLRIITCSMPHVRSATVCFYVGAGSRFEPDDKAGLAHFVEHMVFKGTRSYPRARHISEAIEGVGGILDASTSAEVTVYWAKVAEQHFSRALDVLADMLQHPLLDPVEIEKERRVIIEELNMITDSPADWTFNLIAEALWPAHALGRDVAGTKAGVATIRRSDLQAYQEAHYTPERIVAVVAGSLQAPRVEEAVAAALADLPWPSPVPPNPAPELVPGVRIRLGYRAIEQANVCLALPALSYSHPDRYPLLLLDTILGAGMSSRLFQTIREERALAYSIYAGVRQYADTGTLIIYAGVDPGRIEECLGAVWQELARLVEEDVSTEELAHAKEYNKGRMLLRLEDSYGVASWHGMQEVLTDQIETIDEVLGQIEAVQPADLRRLAGELFHRERLRLAVVGPFRDEAPFRRVLGI